MSPSLSLLSCRYSTPDVVHPPLGAMMLASAVERRGHPCGILDHQLTPGAHLFGVQALEDDLSALDGDVLGISAFSDALPEVLLALDRLGDTGRPVVLGGPAVAGNEARILATSPRVTWVVTGEGEDALAGLLDDLRDGREPTRPGLWRRDRDGVPTGLPPVRLRDLDALPPPAWEHVDARRYHRLDTLTARGCPFACAFCHTPAWLGRGMATRDVEAVVAEIRDVAARTGLGQVHLLDDTFCLDLDRVRRFCAAMTREAPPLAWRCFNRIDTSPDALAPLLAEAGCVQVFYGIDGGSPGTWSTAGKGLDRDRIVDRIRHALASTDVVLSSIWGFPGETFEDFRAAIALAFDLVSLSTPTHQATFQLHFLSPTRATRLYADHGASLRFAEDLPLDFTHGPLSALPATGDRDACVALIRALPDLCCGFHHYPTPDLERKRDVVLDGRQRWEAARTRILLRPDRDAALSDEAHHLLASAAPDTDDGLAAMLAWISLAGSLTAEGRASLRDAPAPADLLGRAARTALQGDDLTLLLDLLGSQPDPA